MNYEWLKPIATKYSVISFDIFDTLLKRDVYKPKDLFELIEQGYCSNLSLKSDLSVLQGFAEKRLLLMKYIKIFVAILKTKQKNLKSWR